ncbi:MAG: winged helix-turn-helix transcriptional regulator [Lutibacter sp.]|nr:winged helix-turn-helix transcriptional regulator [Lutibacter sp.]
MVLRKSYHEIPPRVEYSLTQASKDLEPLFEKLGTWVKQYF